MRAAVLEAFGEPLALKDVPAPEPGPGEILVRTRAVGLCGTDLKVVSGRLPGLRTPLIPGHEVAGEVVTTAHGFEAGERVAVYLYEPCGRCPWCEAGRHALCPTAGRLGRSRDGGLAEYLVVRAENALRFDPGLDFAAAAVAMDAVATSLRALRVRARLSAGESLAITGAGGLGLHAVQLAVATGARVAVLDPSSAARRRAVELGAQLAVIPQEAINVFDWAGGGVDVALEASGRADGLEILMDLMRPGGCLVCCGYSPDSRLAIRSERLVLEELSILGSRASSRQDAVEALRLVESGEVSAQVGSRMALDEVNQALAELAAGSVAGRIVVEFQA